MTEQLPEAFETYAALSIDISARLLIPEGWELVSIGIFPTPEVVLCRTDEELDAGAPDDWARGRGDSIGSALAAAGRKARSRT